VGGIGEFWTGRKGLVWFWGWRGTRRQSVRRAHTQTQSTNTFRSVGLTEPHGTRQVNLIGSCQTEKVKHHAKRVFFLVTLIQNKCR
jgi:hypothetical protein